MLTLGPNETDDFAGVSRQGGSGVGGGTAAGRHHAVQIRPRRRYAQVKSLSCVACDRPVAGVAVVLQDRVFCTWDCAVGVAGTVPGRYFG